MKNILIVMLMLVFVSTDLTGQTTPKKVPPKNKPQTAPTKLKPKAAPSKATPATSKTKAAPTKSRRARQSEAEVRRGPTIEARVHTWYFGNFFQAPDDRPKENVPALGIEGRLTHPLPLESIGQPVDAYVNLDYLQFFQSGFGGSPGLRAGARSEGRPHFWDASAQIQKDRPAFDVGDQVDKADIARLLGEYGYRFGRDWQFGADATLEKQSFSAAADSDSRFSEVGGSVRYRGFGSIFSPEIGFAAGRREVDDPTGDYRQRDLILQVRSAPTPPLYLSARLRHRVRNYSTGNAASSNFGRDDTRDQLVLSADRKHNATITWNLYFAYETADSTLGTRSFDTFLTAFGLTYRLK